MKHGACNDYDSNYKWWVLPDKPATDQVYQRSGSSITGPDWAKNTDQRNRFKDLLIRDCKGLWMESSDRYFFELKEDYETFLLMCNLLT